jgi:hypothetical protein
MNNRFPSSFAGERDSAGRRYRGVRSMQKSGTLTVKKSDGHSERGVLNDLSGEKAELSRACFAQPPKNDTSSGEKFCELRRDQSEKRSEHGVEQLHHGDVVRIGRGIVIGNGVVLLRRLEDQGNSDRARIAQQP